MCESVPNYGLKVPLSHVYPEKWNQHHMPRLRQLYDLFPLIIRYLIYYVKAKWARKPVVMDYIKLVNAKQIYGVPLGGIGGGTIGRGFRGEFCRFQLNAGLYEYYTVDADQFIVTIKDANGKTCFHSLLSTFPRKTLKSWKNRLDPTKCFYTGLYPRSWTEYDLSAYGIKLICRQISPILPHNYKDTSLPCGIFVWDAENLSDHDVKSITIAFTFRNGTGNRKYNNSGLCKSREFNYCGVEGVILDHTIGGLQCAYALSTRTLSTVSKCLYFDTNSDGSIPWTQLEQNGAFAPITKHDSNEKCGSFGCGIAVQMKLEVRQKCRIEMSLVWHMPLVQFPRTEQIMERYYTTYFNGPDTIEKLSLYALDNWPSWEQDIYRWQAPILTDPLLPDWFKTALFNETYYLSDGGSLWLISPDRDVLSEKDPRRTVGRFFYLEGHEYIMCNTYDVHFYASVALMRHFPQLQLAVQYDFRDAVVQEMPQSVKMLYDGVCVERKVKNTVPHDLGTPDEAPFTYINSYPIHDVSKWRDLNVKFVIQVFRDVSVLDSAEKLTYLEDMYKTCTILMRTTEKFDTDNDDVIENSSEPDQTFDAWIMSGTSAYCGGLWLVALFAMRQMAELLNRPDDVHRYGEKLVCGIQSFNRKLWNGKYYNFDCSNCHKSTIMADQLCAHLFMRLAGYNYEVYAQDRVVSCLETIYDENVRKFCQGRMGAVNGMIKGCVDPSSIQSEEVWTGVTYALAATMIFEGMVSEGFDTAKGMFSTLNERIGLAFSTPEALYASKHYRAVGYMRPLSIWAMLEAYEKSNAKSQ